MNTTQNEIILYQPDNSLALEVRLEDETVWLSQNQMAELFQTTVPNINLHLKNIYEDIELEEHRTIKDFLIVRKATIYTKQISSQLQLDLARHNAQYEPINICESANFHDRFLIIDEVVYHIGASFKDLGKKLFAFSKMEIAARILLQGN